MVPRKRRQPVIHVHVIGHPDTAASHALESVSRGTPSEELQPALPLDAQIESAAEPNVTRDKLRTLDDWEIWLRWQFRQVELLGEIDITEVEWRKLARLIGERIRDLPKRLILRVLSQAYPATFAMYLVTQGVYGYASGDYWTGVRNQTGLKKTQLADWGRLFEEVLDRFHLPRFPDIPGHRFVAVILAHGGIPDYCLPDFFAHVLMPAKTRSKYTGLPTDELIDALLERSEIQNFSDVPIRRFLEFGGRVSHEFLERCLEMVDTYMLIGEIPEAAEVGLPPRVVRRFADWVSDQEQLEDQRGVEGTLRLRSPQLIFDPWGDGVSLRLPSQTMRRPLPAHLLESDVSGMTFG